jgi:hypothetical protein
MNVDIPEACTLQTKNQRTPAPENVYPYNFELGGRKVYFAKVCGRHMVNAQVQSPKAASIALAYRTLSILMKESMGEDAYTYEQLLDFTTEEISPILESIQ